MDVICADLDWQQPGGQGNSQTAMDKMVFPEGEGNIDCVQAAFEIAGGAHTIMVNGEILGSSVVYYA